MKHALINPDQPCMSYDNPPVVLGAYVVEVEELKFPVAEPLFWADCSDNIVAYQFYWNNNFFNPIPEQPIPPRDIAAEWEAVRRERNKRLAASDWSQLPDAQAAMSDERKAAWITYRQALRDITTAFSDPADVVWPTQPV